MLAQRQVPGWGLLVATLSLTLPILSLKPVDVFSNVGVVRVVGVVRSSLSSINVVVSCATPPTGQYPFFPDKAHCNASRIKPFPSPTPYVFKRRAKPPVRSAITLCIPLRKISKYFC